MDVNGAGDKLGADLCVLLEAPPDTMVRNVRLLTPVLTGWSYNLVVNDRGAMHAEVAVIEERPWMRCSKRFREVIPVEVIGTDRTLDQTVLEIEVKTMLLDPSASTGRRAHGAV